MDVYVKKLVVLNYIVNVLLMEKCALKSVLVLNAVIQVKIKMK